MGFKFLICISFHIKVFCCGSYFFKATNGSRSFLPFPFAPSFIIERPMYSQMTKRQIASKELIKDWMTLYVGLFSSTDIYWNICLTPVVGKALC